MPFPTEQVVIGITALIGAIITGAFSIINTRISKQLSEVKKKSTANGVLTTENAILEQIVPALERKDEALDKIAEILDNILRAQTLTSQQLKGMSIILENRCQALEILKALESIAEASRRQGKLNNDVPEIIKTTVASLQDTEKGGEL